MDRVVGKWDAPIPDPRQSLAKSSHKQQPGSRGQQRYESPMRVIMPEENPLGQLVGDRSPEREDLIRADLIDPRSHNPFTIKR